MFIARACSGLPRIVSEEMPARAHRTRVLDGLQPEVAGGAGEAGSLERGSRGGSSTSGRGGNVLTPLPADLSCRRERGGEAPSEDQGRLLRDSRCCGQWAVPELEVSFLHS